MEFESNFFGALFQSIEIAQLCAIILYEHSNGMQYKN